MASLPEDGFVDKCHLRQRDTFAYVIWSYGLAEIYVPFVDVTGAHAGESASTAVGLPIRAGGSEIAVASYSNGHLE